MNKRIDNLKGEMKAVDNRLEEMNDKMDRLLEIVLASQS